MDIQRTIEFILEQQPAMTTRQDSILKLVETGMKMLVDHGQKINMLIDSDMRLVAAQQATDERLNRLVTAQQATDERLNRLAESQQITEEKLNRLIEALLRQSTNGY